MYPGPEDFVQCAWQGALELRLGAGPRIVGRGPEGPAPIPPPIPPPHPPYLRAQDCCWVAPPPNSTPGLATLGPRLTDSSLPHAREERSSGGLRRLNVQDESQVHPPRLSICFSA